MPSLPQITNEAQLRKLNQLVEVSLILNSTLELEPLLRKIMDAAADITEAESASILLMEPKSQELHFMAFNTEGGETALALRRIPVPLQGSVAGAVVLQNSPLVLNDVTQDPRHYRAADDHSGYQTHSLLAIPMRIRDRVIGVLEAVNKRGDSWTEDDQTFLEILAAQAAIAIENASLVSRLRSAYEELSQLDKMKNDFIAIASHELRTPLGVILGYASFLKDDAEGEASTHADAVLNSALKMRQIVEDMTNLRYLKVGERELNLESASVNTLMLLSLSDVQNLMAENENQLEMEKPPPDLHIRIDLSKMVMALTNVLNNAVRFSPPGSPIRFGYQLRGDELWLLVEDEGIGIPAGELERIFKEFYQVENHMVRRHNGMGLGLAIARAVVEAHGGRIWAESAGANQGACFYVSLPLKG